MDKIFVATCVLSAVWFNVSGSIVIKRSACKEDETFVECAHCGPGSCEELGRPKPCTGSTGLCRPECVCMDGHVRDANGDCIMKSQCPDCGGDRNATSGCGDHCGRSCSDYTDLNKTCFSSCQYNRCDCKEGFVFHDSLGVCVLPEDC
ncbi:venom peptide BmKAPI-like [Cydia pomonella]|uniref:venom peptide BmKAPI-like n=1 Tax=Cydia pomonella TaxID=82600 RepID=UPI002ADD53B0|nr:venom peptide BmKAPI-like [Cydia pomonella]